MLNLKYKIWLEDDGKVFGKGPYDLLLGVRDYGSLAESAKHLNMSYNKAFTLIKSIEKRLGYKLIDTQAGGMNGGGSQLTEEANGLMSNYEAFIKACDESLTALFSEYFR